MMGFNFSKEKKYDKIVGIAKLGRIIKFTDKLDGRENSLGDWEIINFLRLVSNLEPNTKFIFLTSSNLPKIDKSVYDFLFPNKNVFSLDYTRKSKVPFGDHIKKDPLALECQHLFVFAGPNSKVSGALPIKSEKDGHILRPICMMERYTRPLIEFLNESKMKYSYIITDNRYFPMSYDLINPPIKIFAQSSEDFTYLYKHHKSFDTDIQPEIDEIPVKSRSIETLWMYDKKYNEINDTKRKNKFLIIANQISPDYKNDSRYKMIHDYFVKNEIDFDLIGKWKETPKGFENNLPFGIDGVDPNVLSSIIRGYKYSVIFNYDSTLSSAKIKEKNKKIDWITVKYLESVFEGTIPIYIEYNNPLINKNKDDLKELTWIKNKNEANKLKKLLEKNDNSSFILSNDLKNGKYIYDNIYLHGVCL